MLVIPDSIRRKIGDEQYEIDDVGMSESSVFLFSDKVLKIQEDSEEARNEVEAMQWLEGRLSVPKVIEHVCQDGKLYLAMTRVSGKMACDECYMNDLEKLTDLLARSLQELWKVDTCVCPMSWTLDRKLKAAQYSVDNHLVDVENVEPETFGPDGFKDPEELLQWLKMHRPEEELVFSHGDFCLPNIFFEEDGRACFIDLVRTGISDKWQDIGLCYRSLKHNFSGKYGGKVYPGYEPDMLFKKLGLEPDWEKIRYYILLDELF